MEIEELSKLNQEELSYFLMANNLFLRGGEESARELFLLEFMWLDNFKVECFMLNQTN